MSIGLTFSLLEQGYRDACIGVYVCDRIEVSQRHLEQIVDMIMQPRPDAETGELIYTEGQLRYRKEAMEGKHPVLFMGAQVLAIGDFENQIRFVNMARPDRTHSITV